MMTYIDAGCWGIEFFSGNGFLCGHDGFHREGWEQIGFPELPFNSSSPRRAEQCVNRCERYRTCFYYDFILKC